MPLPSEVRPIPQIYLRDKRRWKSQEPAPRDYDCGSLGRYRNSFFFLAQIPLHVSSVVSGLTGQSFHLHSDCAPTRARFKALHLMS